MLRHEIEERAAATPASQVRVSPRELAEALLALEEQHAAEERRLSDTIPLGQAIEDLEIDASPEELLSALQARRSAQAAARLAVPGLRRRRNVARIAFVSMVVSLCVLPWMVGRESVSVVTSPASESVSTSGSARGMTLRKLADVPVGGRFFCDADTLLRLAQGEAPGSTMVEMNLPYGELWSVVRTSDGYVVEGWASPTDVLKLANGGGAELFRSDDRYSGNGPGTPVQVAIDHLTHAVKSASHNDAITVNP